MDHVLYLFGEIERNEEYKKAARLHKGLSKELVEEIYHLAIFAVWRYPDNDVMCIPKMGIRITMLS